MGEILIFSQKSFKKLMAGALLSAAVLGSYGYGSVNEVSAATAQSVTKGVASSNVYMRSQPSTSGKVVDRVYKGDSVQILGSSSGWYKIKTSSGKQGYASSKLITPSNGSSNNSGNNSGSNSGNNSGSNSGNSGTTTPSTNASVEKVISAGMKYLGTPYEFGSNRSSTKTFDCSAFVRRAFMDGANITLPSNSRTQGQYVKDKGTAVTNVNQLKRGDLVFFMSYKGSSASAYAGLDKSKQRITHVAIYLGDNKLLHTYSKESGGVLVGSFGDSWKNRFLYGGSVL
ncbi:glycoside hydrolase [Paenibacillus glucanolyticus]|jgi:cell wall-associated NlpC family hydrolase|uniref:Glycoside hydrolase n=3 Tax=Paenibacillus TaxID=44249 RepID=A0A163JZ18_9BACL|nr:SH3 domain-containing C40 family peptidase [Paenibacillus glucanolyticus]AWP29648.1 glycoside hydrolase [Paenibacillus sp. Cedars]MDH6673297.1 cell wall-associated NlpC family hydrolase [Paenibacillus sp. LBL]ANA80867.1 glycoside hydrolase [Paenibacillus glucanolyticus]AVV55061.1 glycoside hydrolase [Paenibacillus glucanolyticus]KZS46885.1 glycoside hydrolase [Paenibacillus glucanolyticus]